MDEDGPSSPVAVTVEAPVWWAALEDPERLCESVVRTTLSHAAPAAWREAQANALLTDDDSIRIINADWRGQDRPTNVLAFPAHAVLPADPPPSGPWLGDLVLGAGIAAAEAEELNKPFADHIAHLLVHGTLHLLGFDHDTDLRASEMERIEDEILKRLGFSRPYDDLPLATAKSEKPETEPVSREAELPVCAAAAPAPMTSAETPR